MCVIPVRNNYNLLLKEDPNPQPAAAAGFTLTGAGQAGRAPSSSLVQTHGALQLASLARSGLISAGCALDVASNPAAKLSGVCRPVAEEEEGLIERKSHLSNQDGVLEL